MKLLVKCLYGAGWMLFATCLCSLLWVGILGGQLPANVIQLTTIYALLRGVIGAGLILVMEKKKNAV